MYAIIEEGGRQFKVTSGDVIRIDRPFDENTKNLTFDRVLLVAGEGDPKISIPSVSRATVTTDVNRAAKGPTIDIQKYMRRKGYHRKIGHRQKYTEVRITGIKL